MALIIDLADAVTAELNAAPAGTFDPDIQAVRRVLPEFELADLAELKVSVVPKAVEMGGSTRAACQFDLRIDIGVQKKLGKDLDVETAQLCGLMDRIAAYLRRRPLAGAPGAVWVRTENEPVYAPEHLAGQRVFTSVLTLTYRAVG
ncbi:MAG: hypothetical protein LBT97_03720 [Planctomycetota bacterium]|jgi:hypothetical protein|nr:hypothetical protein [Planctomycetota bacterium]